MPRRWFQFRLSTLLVLVALSAVGADYWRRRSLLLSRALEHQHRAQRYHESAISASLLDHIQELGQLMQHHHNLRDKYERAASFPWLPVAPDPPEPKRLPRSDDDAGGLFRDYPKTFDTETLNPGSSANDNRSSP